MSAFPSTPANAESDKALRAIRGGASWFYWIAGVSLINSLIAAFGGEWNFIFGLGITTVFDAFVSEMTADSAGGLTVVHIIGLGLSLGAVALYVLFGWLANRHKTPAFIAGMVCYGLDSLIFLAAGDLLGIGAHVFAFFGMARGLKALMAAKKEPAEATRTATVRASAPAAAEPESVEQYETVP